MFNYWTIKQTKLIKRWDARLILQVHISCGHHLRPVSPAPFSKNTWDFFSEQQSKQAVRVQARNQALSASQTLFLPVVWSNVWNPESLGLSLRKPPKKLPLFTLPRTWKQSKRMEMNVQWIYFDIFLSIQTKTLKFVFWYMCSLTQQSTSYRSQISICARNAIKKFLKQWKQDLPTTK